MKSLIQLVAVVAAVAGVAGADYHNCKLCVAGAVSKTNCPPTDTHCVCASPLFMSTVHECAEAECGEFDRDATILFASDFCETISTLKPDLRRRDTRWRHRRHKTEEKPAEAESEEKKTLAARASPQNGPYWWDSNYPWPPMKGQHGNKPWWWPSSETWPPQVERIAMLPTRPWWWPQGFEWPPRPGQFPSKPLWWPQGKQWPPPYVNTQEGTVTATVTATVTVW